jgi:hypothetical protein
MPFGPRTDWHVVGDLGHPGAGKKPGHQHVAVGPVPLRRAVVLRRGSDLELSSLVAIEEVAKTLGESKCGKHNQSIDPVVPTRAAVRISPMTP